MIRGSLRTLLILLILVLYTVPSLAFNEPDIRIYNYALITSDPSSTFIEGELLAEGQTIQVCHGYKVIAEKIVPNTHRTTLFRIKIPAEYIGDKKLNLGVRTETDGKKSRAVKVTIEYIPKISQSITTKESSYELLLPSLENNSIAAESTTPVQYSSENADVVEVDEQGNLIPKKDGETAVTIYTPGNGMYESAEKTINVSVKEIDAYKVTFHSRTKKDKTSSQIIDINKKETLDAVTFENGKHEFLGWAEEEDGLVKYSDEEAVSDLAEKGETKDLYAVWSGDGIRAAIAWAIKIAADDSFCYGDKPTANRLGCYFCGTNKETKPKGYEKTYVCLTFVGAAFAHGAEDPDILYACRHKKMPLYLNNNNFSKFSCWKKVGQCKDLTLDDLEPGDVLIDWSDSNGNDGHACIYAGDNDLVEASGGGWSKKSIGLKKNSAAKRLASYGKDKKNYVMRYTGKK